jgi:hypothetical protein
MKHFVIASALVLMATICHARVGETQAQVEARYGKHVKEVKPLAPAGAAYLYRKGELAFFVGFVDGKAAYELVESVEEDGDIGEGELEAKDIDASLKSNAPDGGWKEVTGAQDGNRHWTSADGALIAVYNVKNYQLLIQSSDFLRQRQAGASGTK